MRILLSVVMVMFIAGCSDNEYSIAGSCSDDTSFEIAALSFAFNLNDIDNINVLNGDKASANIRFKDNWLPDLSIITTDENQVTGGIKQHGGFEKLEIDNLTDLFKKAKQDEDTSEYFLRVKKAMNLNNPDHIQLIEHDNANVVVLENAYDNGADAIYVLRKNDTRIMMLIADMNTEETERLLAHVCL